MNTTHWIRPLAYITRIWTDKGRNSVKYSPNESSRDKNKNKVNGIGSHCSKPTLEERQKQEQRNENNDVMGNDENNDKQAWTFVEQKF